MRTFTPPLRANGTEWPQLPAEFDNLVVEATRWARSTGRALGLQRDPGQAVDLGREWLVEVGVPETCVFLLIYVLGCAGLRFRGERAPYEGRAKRPGSIAGDQRAAAEDLEERVEKLRHDLWGGGEAEGRKQVAGNSPTVLAALFHAEEVLRLQPVDLGAVLEALNAAVERGPFRNAEEAEWPNADL